MERAMSLDEFLNHKTNDSSDTTFLRWNKRQPPIVDIWLHTAAKIVGVWRHNWPRVVERTDRDTDEKSLVVWGSNWNCWEPESVLKSQYFRDSETGERRTPPTICPVCLLIERIRRAVLENELDWTTPIFQFDATDSKESRALHAGGIYNAYGRKELTREEIADLKAHRIYRTEAWRENMTAKCSYVLRVVDNDNPGAGIQVSIEGSGLGDKLKAAIKARQKALGVEAGNPQRTPYCIQFEYLPNETRFDNKYNVIPMDRIALTPAVRALIIDEQPPDISHLTKPGNPKKLRAEMESHWCGPDGLIDWDEIFGSVEAAYSEQANEDSSADFPFGANEEKIAKLSNEYVKTTVVINRDDTPDKSDESHDSREIVACDVCGKDMKETDPVCPHCGEVYDEPVVPEPPKPKRSRTEAKPQPSKKLEKKPVRTKAQPAGNVRGDSNSDWGIEPDDDSGLPF